MISWIRPSAPNPQGPPKTHTRPTLLIHAYVLDREPSGWGVTDAAHVVLPAHSLESHKGHLVLCQLKAGDANSLVWGSVRCRSAIPNQCCNLIHEYIKSYIIHELQQTSRYTARKICTGPDPDPPFTIKTTLSLPPLTVPVLSEQMTVRLPKVSTTGSALMMEF